VSKSSLHRVLGSLSVVFSLLVLGLSIDPMNARAAIPSLDCEANAYCSVTEPLDEPTRAAMVGVVWHEGCPVGLEDLRRITFKYWSFDGSIATGQVTVNAGVAVDIQRALHDLFDAKFPIGSAKPIEAFGGDDDRSTLANNSSAFNCRVVTGGKSFSEHAWGRAIDINPVQNPYVRSNGTVLDPKAKRYVKRSALSESTGVITPNGAVVKAFKRIGWTWGGTFGRVKDYQHFSSTGR
jgi:D-alanyl-D-alanine carboxypeptidase